jgi:hypothetical protein
VSKRVKGGGGWRVAVGGRLNPHIDATGWGRGTNGIVGSWGTLEIGLAPLSLGLKKLASLIFIVRSGGRVDHSMEHRVIDGVTNRQCCAIIMIWLMDLISSHLSTSYLFFAQPLLVTT